MGRASRILEECKYTEFTFAQVHIDRQWQHKKMRFQLNKNTLLHYKDHHQHYSYEQQKQKNKYFNNQQEV